MSRKKQSLLTNLELAVMQVVWGSPEPLTVREVVDALNRNRRKPLAYNTVQTMLTILKEKGIVRCKAGAGRAFRYTPRLSREEVSTSMVSDLLEKLFDGQAQPLLIHLVEKRALGKTELEQLKGIIDSQLKDEPEEA